MINSRYQKGLTLIEIMIAITISLILLAGLGQIYMSSKQNYRIVNELSRMQENGRFALDFLVKTIREADHMGCLSRQNSVFSGVQVSDNVTTSGLTNYDTITIISASENSVSVSSAVSPGNTINLDDVSNFEVGDSILLSDCEKAHVGTITAVNTTGSSITIAERINQAFSLSSVVSELITSTYSLGINSAGNPAMFLNDGVSNQELVEGVENLQITLGVDSDSDKVPNYYVDAGSVANMDDVVSIKLDLTVRTLSDNTATSTRTSGPYTDQRIAKNYKATVALRNRLN